MRNKTPFFRLFLCSLILLAGKAGAQLSFSSPDSLFAYADRNSASSKVSAQQSLLAKWTKVAALANTINFRNPVSFSATDNIQLPVNFIPAEIFGGPAGSFREITLGQQYVSNFNFNPQIDLINPASWARVKSAELNREMTAVTNSLARKALHESIAAAYYNIMACSEQIEISEQSALLSDSLVSIARNKYGMGLIREQDLDNARVNGLLIKDKLQQLKAGRGQQLNALKVLCDIQANTSVILRDNGADNSSSLKAGSTLEARYQQLQSQLMRSELRASRLSTLPVVSLVYYQGWQKNSNQSLFDSEARWIPTKYIGLRISVPFPPDASKLSQNYTSRANYNIAAINASHQQLQNELGNRSLELDLEKNASSLETATEIAALKERNYQKSLNQYREGILPTDYLLTAFTDLLNSRLSLASARAALGYSRSKIIINNSLK